MSFDLKLFGHKIRRCREQLSLDVYEVANVIGIESFRLNQLEDGHVEPTGDEVLILSDFFKQDYNFFISNQQKSASEQVDFLYRKFGTELSKKDRWSIQEFIFLCESESYVFAQMDISSSKFYFKPTGSYFKQHGSAAAIELRNFLNLTPLDTIPDIFSLIRKLGIHVFRRKLENSSVSGLLINHPLAGQCILINYDEDLFRQNFTAAHELAHAIFDYEKSANVSFTNDGSDLREVRANTFASEFLVPSETIQKLRGRSFDEDLICNISLKLKVNPQVLLIALKNSNVISEGDYRKLIGTKINRSQKLDPELRGLSEKIAVAKQDVLQRGLSTYYVRKCHEAYQNGIISANKLADMFLCNEYELPTMLQLFNLQLSHEP